MKTGERKESDRILFKTDEIEHTFQSISEHGLLPLSKIPKASCFPNPTSAAREAHGTIAVNHIALFGKRFSEEKLESALTIACYEEYTGIYGIALERRWPFQYMNNPTLFKEELRLRLCSSIVFLLSLSPENVKAPLAIEEIKEIKEIRAALLIESKVEETTDTKTILQEQKLETMFPMKNVYAILVPEPLVTLAKLYFKNYEIISVPIQETTLTKLPEMLATYHQQKLKTHITVEAPQYLPALKSYVLRGGSPTTFAIHAVRLNTPFDFAYRYIDDLKQHQKLLTQISAKTISVKDNAGWIEVHKTYAMPLDFKPLLKIFNSQKIGELKHANQYYETLYQQLKVTKGDVCMQNVYGALTQEQIQRLEARNVKIFNINNYWILAFPPSLKAFVKKEIIDKPNAVKILLASISACFFYTNRTKLAQTQMKLQENTKKIDTLQLELSTLQQHNQSLQEEIQTTRAIFS